MKHNSTDGVAACLAPLTDERAMRVVINACDSLNITRLHELGRKTQTICDEAGLLEIVRAVEAAHGIAGVDVPVKGGLPDPVGYESPTLEGVIYHASDAPLDKSLPVFSLAQVLELLRNAGVPVGDPPENIPALIDTLKAWGNAPTKSGDTLVPSLLLRAAAALEHVSGVGARVEPSTADAIVQLACKWYDTGRGKPDVAHELALAVLRHKQAAAGVEGTLPEHYGCDYGDRCAYPRCLEVGSCHKAVAPGVAGTLAPQPFDGDKFMAWLKELAQAVGPALVVNSPAGGLLRLAATDKLVEFYEKHCTHGVPPFDPTKPCVLTTADPARTYCERCKNPHHACDHASGVSPTDGKVVGSQPPMDSESEG